MADSVKCNTQEFTYPTPQSVFTSKAVRKCQSCLDSEVLLQHGKVVISKHMAMHTRISYQIKPKLASYHPLMTDSFNCRQHSEQVFVVGMSRFAQSTVDKHMTNAVNGSATGIAQAFAAWKDSPFIHKQALQSTNPLLSTMVCNNTKLPHAHVTSVHSVCQKTAARVCHCLNLDAIDPAVPCCWRHFDECA
ncbi:hypothetical protein ABBQ38_003334 [Trebouxia sp. C0009 RCD-2024]